MCFEFSLFCLSGFTSPGRSTPFLRGLHPLRLCPRFPRLIPLTCTSEAERCRFCVFRFPFVFLLFNFPLWLSTLFIPPIPRGIGFFFLQPSYDPFPGRCTSPPRNAVGLRRGPSSYPSILTCHTMMVIGRYLLREILIRQTCFAEVLFPLIFKSMCEATIVKEVSVCTQGKF